MAQSHAYLYTKFPYEKPLTLARTIYFVGNIRYPQSLKQTFKNLLKKMTYEVLMLTHDGYCRQKGGLAVVSPPALPLAYGWLYTYDPRNHDDEKLYS